MRVGYVVSRFPHVSETFIVREMDAVAQHPDIDLELFSLFPAKATTVHGLAEPWVARLQRGSPTLALIGLFTWLARRPFRLVATVARVVAGHGRSPRHLLRALATLPIAAQHAISARTGGVDHLHAHYATYPALAAWVASRLTGIPYSFTAHAHDLYVDQSMLERKVADADFVVAISDFNRAFLRDYGGDRVTPVHVVRCGIDADAYDVEREPIPAAGPVRALCVASLQEYKGHRYLLDALAQPGLERIELDLVGDGELRDELRAQAQRLGVGQRVRFHGGLEEQQVRDLIARAHLFVLPSVVAADGQMEGLPVALMEALAGSLPVVTTRLSGIPELVRDGETGLLAEPADPAGLARALVATLADPEAARARAAAGRALVRAEFTLAQTAAAMSKLLLGGR